MKRMLPYCLALLALFVVGVQEARAGILYDFESVALGTSTPFTDTKGGVTASFSSSGDPGGFTITSSFWAPPISGHVLFDPGPSGASSIPLTVSFSHSLTSVSMDFATDGASAFDLVTAVGSASVTGVIPPGFGFPQGSISFSSATPFSSITLSAPSVPFFAVDNIDITVVPEPGSLALLAIGVVGALGYSWRRSNRVRDCTVAGSK